MQSSTLAFEDLLYGWWPDSRVAANCTAMRLDLADVVPENAGVADGNLGGLLVCDSRGEGGGGWSGPCNGWFRTF